MSCIKIRDYENGGIKMQDCTIGIYKIFNKVNDKLYIGSSINIVGRWKKHIYDLNNGIHHNIHLQRAWNKYGEDNFGFKIIELVDGEDNLVEKEQYWIEQSNCCNPDFGYNLSLDASRPNTYDQKTYVKIIRKDVQDLIINKNINKNEGYLLFTLIPFLSRDNSIKINNQHPSFEKLETIVDVGRNVFYANIKSLKDKNYIKTINDGKNKIIYINPYLFCFGKLIDNSIYKLFGITT